MPGARARAKRPAAAVHLSLALPRGLGCAGILILRALELRPNKQGRAVTHAHVWTPVTQRAAPVSTHAVAPSPLHRRHRRSPLALDGRRKLRRAPVPHRRLSSIVEEVQCGGRLSRIKTAATAAAAAAAARSGRSLHARGTQAARSGPRNHNTRSAELSRAQQSCVARQQGGRGEEGARGGVLRKADLGAPDAPQVLLAIKTDAAAAEELERIHCSAACRARPKPLVLRRLVRSCAVQTRPACHFD